MFPSRAFVEEGPLFTLRKEDNTMSMLEFAGHCAAFGFMLLFVAWGMAVANTANGRTPTKGEDRVMGWFAFPSLLLLLTALIVLLAAGLQALWAVVTA